MLKEIKVNEPNPRLVEILERLLAAAKKGEIHSIMAVYQGCDRSCNYMFTFDEKAYVRSMLAEAQIASVDIINNELLSDRDSATHRHLWGEE